MTHRPSPPEASPDTPEAIAAARGRLEAYCADHTHDGYSNMHTGRLYAGYCPNSQPNVSFDVAVENFLADIRTVLSFTARDRRVGELEQVLRPFAALVSRLRDSTPDSNQPGFGLSYRPTAGHIRAAARALSTIEAQEPKL